MRPAFSVLGLAGGLALLNGVFWLRNISKLLTECSFKFDLEILSMLPNNSSHEATGHSTLPVVVLATVLITLRTGWILTSEIFRTGCQFSKSPWSLTGAWLKSGWRTLHSLSSGFDKQNALHWATPVWLSLWQRGVFVPSLRLRSLPHMLRRLLGDFSDDLRISLGDSQHAENVLARQDKKQTQVVLCNDNSELSASATLSATWRTKGMTHVWSGTTWGPRVSLL